MKDFNIAKYLKEHNLGSYGKLNHYVDLKPLKEEDAEIPYEGPDAKLDGFSDEFDQAETVSEQAGGSSTLEIDWNGSIPRLTKLAEKYDLSFEVTDEYGPAGGAMVVQLTGTREDLIYFITQAYSPEDRIFGADMIDTIQ